MLLLEGTLFLTAEKIEAAKEKLIAYAQACRAETGCLEFVFSVNIENAGMLNMRERFVDLKAFEIHRTTKHFLEFRTYLNDIGMSGRDVRFYENVLPVQR